MSALLDILAAMGCSVKVADDADAQSNDALGSARRGGRHPGIDERREQQRRVRDRPRHRPGGGHLRRAGGGLASERGRKAIEETNSYNERALKVYERVGFRRTKVVYKASEVAFAEWQV